MKDRQTLGPLNDHKSIDGSIDRFPFIFIREVTNQTSTGPSASEIISFISRADNYYCCCDI